LFQPFYQYKVYQLDYNRKTGEWRMLERFYPEVRVVFEQVQPDFPLISFRRKRKKDRPPKDQRRTLMEEARVFGRPKWGSNACPGIVAWVSTARRCWRLARGLGWYE
jgi:hypothetical protein